MPEEQRPRGLGERPDGGVGLVVAPQGPGPAVCLSGEGRCGRSGRAVVAGAVPGHPPGSFPAGSQDDSVRPGRPGAAVAGVEEGLAGAGGEGLGPAAGSAAGADGRDGAVGGAPAKGLRHADPAGAARTEERLGLGDPGVGRRRRLGGADPGGEQDRPPPRLRYAIVGGVEDAGPHGKPPAAQHGGVLLPQRQDVRYFLHGDPLRLSDGVEGVQVAHGLGCEQRALVTAGGEELVAGVASGGEVLDRLMHERLVHKAEALAGHRPRLARR